MTTVEFLNYDVVDDNGWDLYDEETFTKAADLGLPDEDYGFFEVPQGQYVLEAAEAAGYEWPFSCRGGICSNCAAVVVTGDIEMDGNQALSPTEVEDKQVRLTCIGRPTTEYLRIVYGAKYLPYLQDRIM